MRLVRRLTLILATCLMALAVPRAQVRRDLLRDWLDTVRDHQPGQWDAAAQTIGGWSSAEFRAVYEALQPQLGEPGHRREDMNALLLSGAMLHTDIAILGAGRRIKTAPGDRLVSLARDGRGIGQQAMEPGWAFARQLLEAIAPVAVGHPIVKLWYRATTAYMAQYALLGNVLPHLAQAHRLFPNDADVLMDEGWMYEAIAGPRTQAAVAEVGTPAGMRIDTPSPGDSLKNAEECFTRALAIDPALVEARVRRGRVRSVRGNQKDAIVDLRAAVDTATDPFVKYHALLFLGGAYEALDSIEQANTAYERAAVLYPLAQSPHLALSRLAIRRGDMPAAQRDMQQVLHLAPTAPNRGDPWWFYYMGSGRKTNALFTELRAAIAAAPGGS